MALDNTGLGDVEAMPTCEGCQRVTRSRRRQLPVPGGGISEARAIRVGGPGNLLQHAGRSDKVGAASFERQEHQHIVHPEVQRVRSFHSPEHGRPKERWCLAATVLSVAVLGSGCGGSGHHHSAKSPTEKPISTLPEAQLRKQALALLTPSTHITMHGVKTTKGGLPLTKIHTPDSKSYVFEAACAGSGKMDFHWVTKVVHSGPLQTLTCGGGVLSYRFQGSDLVSVELQTLRATGVLAWQVIPQTR